MKKRIVSLILVVAFMLSMTMYVFAGDDISPIIASYSTGSHQITLARH